MYWSACLYPSNSQYLPVYWQLLHVLALNIIECISMIKYQHFSWSFYEGIILIGNHQLRSSSAKTDSCHPTKNHQADDRYFDDPTTLFISSKHMFILNGGSPGPWVSKLKMLIWDDLEGPPILGNIGNVRVIKSPGAPSAPARDARGGSCVSRCSGSGSTWRSKIGQATDHLYRELLVITK